MLLRIPLVFRSLNYNEVMRWAVVLLVTLYSLTLFPLLVRFSRSLVRRIRPWLPRMEQASFYNMCVRLPIQEGKYRREMSHETYGGVFESRNTVMESRSDPDGLTRLEIRLSVLQTFRLVLSRVREKEEDQTLEGFFFRSEQIEAAKEFLSNALVLQELQQVGEFDSIEIGGSGLNCRVSGVIADAADLLKVLSSLSRLAHFYEIHSRDLRVWVAAPSAAVCAYCREELGQTRARIHECSRCGARMHRECYEENGRCTTYGCNTE